MTKYGQKFSNGPINPFKCTNLLGAVLSIFENCRVKGHGHHMNKYGQKASFGATAPFKYTRQELFSIKETY